MTKLITPVRSGITQSSSFPVLGNTKAKHAVSGSKQLVALHDILRDDSLQVRSRVEPKTVRQYSEAMRGGAEFPAITLARIDGSLLLVDGWHRVEAALSNNEYAIWANVFVMTFDEAKWQAAKANTQHGLPLKTKEYREVFRAFIDSEQHRQGRKLMPYREIARHIGKGFSTVRNWMKADYPQLFKKYQEMSNSAADAGKVDREAKMMQRRLTKAEAGVRNARNIGRTLDPVHLGVLINTLGETLATLQNRPYEAVIPITDINDF